MILRSLSKYRDTGLLILRILIGLSFLAHGLPKLTAGPELWIKLGKSMEFLGVFSYPLFWGLVSALTESIGGFLLLIGFCLKVDRHLLERLRSMQRIGGQSRGMW